MADEHDLTAVLKDISVEHWNTRKSPILLSQLPGKLEPLVPGYKDLLAGKSLKAFALESGASAGFKLVEHPIQRAKLGLVPFDVEFEFPKDDQSKEGDTSAGFSRHGSTDRTLRNEEPVLALLRALRWLPEEELEKVVIPVSALVKLLK